MSNTTEDVLRETMANLLGGADQRAGDAVGRLAYQYGSAELLGECVLFARYNFVDGWPSDLEALSRVGSFPWVVAEHELNVALYQALLAMYASAYDNLRRATEITMVGALFISGRAAIEESTGWVTSERHTPFFSTALARLLQDRRFGALEAETEWAGRLRAWYGRLADVTHVRGMDYWVRSRVSSGRNGMTLPSHDSGALENVADAYITTVQHVCTMLATANPVLLHGLPLDEKFGLDPPMGGFFNSLQAERLWRLLPVDVQPFFKQLAQTDPDVAAVIRHIGGLPDLTDEQIQAQAEHIRHFIERHRAKASD